MRTKMRIPTMRPAWRVPPFFSAALSSVEAPLSLRCSAIFVSSSVGRLVGICDVTALLVVVRTLNCVVVVCAVVVVWDVSPGSVFSHIFSFDCTSSGHPLSTQSCRWRSNPLEHLWSLLHQLQLKPICEDTQGPQPLNWRHVGSGVISTAEMLVILDICSSTRWYS